jgi:hypothetical protein
MFGMMAKPKCPNCGDGSRYKDKVCDSCGYKEIESKSLSEMMLVFCGECGATYGCLELIPTCPSHGAKDFVVKAKK